MNKICELIRSEGLYSLLVRIFYSIKRRVFVRLYFLHNIRWNEKQLLEQKNESHTKDILFSIITPAYNTPEEYLREMIQSCIRQTYTNWELCIADASDEKHSYVGNIISEIKDSRIRYIKLKDNRGISCNTNEALKVANGDYIVMLDHDDMLHPSALYECIKVLEKQHADVIYTDELVFKDKISNILSLHLKPDFSPDSLTGNNYICHMSVISHRFFDDTDFFKRKYDGSQDYDMLLRITEQTKDIVHIPMVLYFWRSHSASVAGDISAKSYAADAGRRALESHFKRIGRYACVRSNPEFPTVYNVSYNVPDKERISVLIWGTLKNPVSYDGIEALTKNTDYGIYEIYAGGNVLDEDKEIIAGKFSLMETASEMCDFFNMASGKAKGKYVICMNGMADIVSKDWLSWLLMFSQRDGTGIVSPKVLSSENIIAECGVYEKNSDKKRLKYISRGLNRKNCGYMMRNMYAHNEDIPGTACLMIEKKKLLDAGGFEPGHTAGSCIAGLCLKIKGLGYSNICNPLSEIIMRQY